MDLPRGVARLVGGEIDRERGDLLRRAEPAHGLAVDERLAHDLLGLPVFLASVAMRSSSDGLSMVPGQIALTRMPLRMNPPRQTS